MNQNPLSTRVKILFAASFWLLFLCVDILKKSILSTQDPYYLYAFYFFGFVLWFLLTFPLYSIFRKTRHLKSALRFIALVTLAPIVGSMKVLLSWTSYYIAVSISRDVSTNYLEFMTKQTSFHYVEASIIAWVLLLLFFLSETYFKYRSKSLEAAELEAQLYRTQLEALKMQIQPHFLFNSHNTIAMLIRTKMYDQAIEMTTKLSDLLRATLDNKSDQFVLLSEEIVLIEKYLDIERIRFEDTLEVKINIPDECQLVAIPNLILQPIVENAVKHGISNHLGKSRIEISAFRKGDRLQIEVYNTGPAVDDDFSIINSTRIGLHNVRSRLRTCYEDDYELGLINKDNGVVCYINKPMTDG